MIKFRNKKDRAVKWHHGTQDLREEGTIVKDWGGRLPIALIYPNSYYVGMSNLGVHAIYKLLNNNMRVLCERVFYEPDKKHVPTAIESGRPLTDFAVLAFSISYELDYFNVMAVLKASGIPLYSGERDESHPLIIAGGPCVTANPLTLAPFFDCLCIGEAEAILPGMIPSLFEGIGESRDNLLRTLSRLPGVYVPPYPPDKPVVRQWVEDLDELPVTSVVLTPDTELGELFLIEVQRGCQRGCRFCLVNSVFAPMRFRSVENMLKQAWEGLHYRRRVGLVGPAITNHPQLTELLSGLLKLNAELSISSLHIKSVSPDILNALARGKAQTITIAPEAGSQRLREVINKGISYDDIMAAMDMIARHNFAQLKLYYIIGLPTETDEDAEEIAKLTLAIKDRLEQRRCNTRIILNASPFVPKAGTPFQWLPMASRETLGQRLTMLRSTLPLKGVKLNEESPAWSQIQGVLARGDDKLAPVLAGMEEVSLAAWRRAVEENHIDMDYYVNRIWDTDAGLPWGFIDMGIDNEKLCKELERALT
jgi:radical SAM superfamily enzyme YgiQ (UPF0313 family)